MGLFNISIILTSNKPVIEFKPLVKEKGNPIKKTTRKNNFVEIVNRE